MAIKPPDLLNRLPSVSELLEKPPIRALADRWNRSVVAGGVRSFLEELRSDFERRAADLPSIRELAERAARFVVSRQHHSLGVAINATGRIYGSPWMCTPLSEAALERMIAFGREYATEPGAASTKSRSELQASFARLTGSQTAAVVHSYSGAIWLALAALAVDREVLVARAEVGDIDGADSLPKLATAANIALKEVGATNRTTAADYEAAVSPRAAAILKLSNDSYRVVGETAAAELDELVSLARDRELLSIDALGAAPLVTPPASIPWPRRSAQASLAAGADLVIIRGDGAGRRPRLRHPARPSGRYPPHCRTSVVRRLATRPTARGRANRHARVLRPSVARRRFGASMAMPEHVHRKPPQPCRTHGRAAGPRRRHFVGHNGRNAKPNLRGAPGRRLAVVRRGPRGGRRKPCRARSPFANRPRSNSRPHRRRSNHPRSSHRAPAPRQIARRLPPRPDHAANGRVTNVPLPPGEGRAEGERPIVPIVLQPHPAAAAPEPIAGTLRILDWRQRTKRLNAKLCLACPNCKPYVKIVAKSLIHLNLGQLGKCRPPGHPSLVPIGLEF